MLNVMLPLVGALFSGLQRNRNAIAEQAGVAPSTIEKVGAAMEAYLTKDERILQQASAELERARQHDIATQVTDMPSVNFARGMVRPLITFAAMGWYVYARVQNIPLTPEDYAIVGGVLAFWFGMRPFEKRK